uniref:Uncharacterized protein n=1 Tax=Craspedostauros australis TaxID=1486917 RepID=A0A7R9ZP08_9STRA
MTRHYTLPMVRDASSSAGSPSNTRGYDCKPPSATFLHAVLSLFQSLLNLRSRLQVLVLAGRQAGLLTAVQSVSRCSRALGEASLDHLLNHVLHDPLVGLLLCLHHDSLALLRREL